VTGYTAITTNPVTQATASNAVTNSSNFKIGDVVIVQDNTNNGSYGLVTASPTSSTAVSLAMKAAVSVASASISTLNTSATTTVSAGAQVIA
jgi:hypothetical protein